MKIKLISYLLFGLTICGSAFASSAEERMVFCENASGFVWVDKTQACIPENPCKSDDMNIKNAYCVEVEFPAKPHAFEIYIKNVLKTDVKEYKPVTGNDFAGAYYTTDGDYKYFLASKYSYLGVPRSTHNAIAVSCWAYGAEDTKYSLKNDEVMDFARLSCISEDKQFNKTNCEDIANYASELNGTDCSGKLVSVQYRGNYCEIICDAAINYTGEEI